MRSGIAQEYIDKHGDEAVSKLVHDLMQGDPATFKAGYSRENAIIAAADAFDIPRSKVKEQLS
jgi:hypothetical protein